MNHDNPYRSPTSNGKNSRNGERRWRWGLLSVCALVACFNLFFGAIETLDEILNYSRGFGQKTFADVAFAALLTMAFAISPLLAARQWHRKSLASAAILTLVAFVPLVLVIKFALETGSLF